MDHPSFLFIVIDLDSLLHGLNLQKARQSDTKISLSFIISSLQLFCCSFSLLHRENRLCVLSYSSSSVDFIYPSINDSATEEISFKASPNLLSALPNNFETSLRNQQHGDAARRKSKLNSALSSALSVLSRHTQGSVLQGRVLNIQFDKDVPQDYNSVMNSIFRSVSIFIIS